MKEVIVNAISEAFSKMGSNLLHWLMNTIINCSYPLCLLVFIVAMILYIGGYRKSGKYATISLAVYFILQSIGICFK